MVLDGPDAFFKHFIIVRNIWGHLRLVFLKFMFSNKATKIDKIFTIDLTVTTYCQIDSEGFVNFCGLLRKREL